MSISKRCLIIAEAGVNHNGDVGLAKQLIKIAADAGADIVKFQSFKAENVVTKDAKKAEYQVQSTGSNESQYEMIKKLELDRNAHLELVRECKKNNIEFLSTAFDLPSIDLLQELGVRTFKVPSGEITNLPYLEKIAGVAEKIILSTGMATLDEIKSALNVFLDSGISKDKISILHCNTEYPTPFEDVNLDAMLTIRKEFGVATGYSDHTNGIEVAIAAVAMGASIIEKHFTIDKMMEGPDQKASLDPGELKAMVSAIRNIESAMGSGVKEPSPSEKKNMVIARRSVHLLNDLHKGHIIKSEDLIMKRPGNGISPMEYKKLIGRKLQSDLPADHMLSWNDLI